MKISTKKKTKCVVLKDVLFYETIMNHIITCLGLSNENMLYHVVFISCTN